MQDRPTPPSRRRFFVGATAVGAATAALVVLPRTTPAPEQVLAPERELPERGGGYHLSAHVQRYYQTTKI